MAIGIATIKNTLAAILDSGGSIRLLVKLFLQTQKVRKVTHLFGFVSLVVFDLPVVDRLSGALFIYITVFCENS